MITDKEYPATHSMSTAWFGIDKDGNVAIFDFEDNGPVPQGLPEEGEDSIIIDHFSSKDFPFRRLDLTKEQALEIVKILEDVSTFHDEYNFETLIQINPKDKDRFESKLLEVFKKLSDFKEQELITLNEEVGLYLINFGDWSTEELKRMFDSGIVIKWKSFYIDNGDKWSEELKKWEFFPQMMGMPFFLYQQPYNTGQMMELSYKPRSPFKSHQLPKGIADKGMQFDFNFEEKEILQIAEYFPYNVSHSSLDYDREANWLPVGKDTEALIKEYTIQDFWCRNTCFLCDFCFEEEVKHIENFSPFEPIDQPKIVIITLPGEKPVYYNDIFKELSRKAASLPLIYGYPWEDRWKWIDIRNKEGYDDNLIDKYLSHCKIHLEENLDILNPYAIIISKKGFSFLEKHFTTAGKTITISGQEYPIIFSEEISEHIEEIENMLKLPYRGKVIDRILETRMIKEK